MALIAELETRWEACGPVLFGFKMIEPYNIPIPIYKESDEDKDYREAMEYLDRFLAGECL